MRLTREHSRDFGFALLRAAELAHGNRRFATAFDLIEDVVTLGPRRDLRQMGDADDLPMSRKLSDPRAHRRRGGTTDSGVDFVKDQRFARVTRLRKRDDDRKQDAR